MAMTMAASFAARHHHGHLAAGLPSTPQAGGRTSRSGATISMKAQVEARPRKSRAVRLEVGKGPGTGESAVGGECGVAGNWYAQQPNKTKEDDMLRYKLDRIPFLEEKVRKVRENGKLVCLDINQLMLSQENRFAFTMEVAEEANAYLEKHRHEYGLKKPILHVLSDRMNEAGFSRPEGYLYPYPINPGPYFIKEEGH